jgi:hypothetical protein
MSWVLNYISTFLLMMRRWQNWRQNEQEEESRSASNVKTNGERTMTSSLCWLPTWSFKLNIAVTLQSHVEWTQSVLARNLFILMTIHIIIPCRMEEKCAVSQLVYIDDHSYYSLMSNGRKVCCLTTCLYWWSFIL